MDQIQVVEHRQGLFSWTSSAPSQLSVIGSLWIRRNQNTFLSLHKQGAETAEHFELVEYAVIMPELRNIEHAEQQNCSISEYSSVIHNDLFVLHLVNVFYFAQLRCSKCSKAQFRLYSAAELVSQAGEILYTELSPDPISTGLHWWGFVAAAYQQWAFNITSAE